MPEPMPAQAVPPEGGREGPEAGGSDVPPRWHKRLAIGLIVLAGIVMSGGESDRLGQAAGA